MLQIKVFGDGTMEHQAQIFQWLTVVTHAHEA